jgi:hypothetical protein
MVNNNYSLKRLDYLKKILETRLIKDEKLLSDAHKEYINAYDVLEKRKSLIERLNVDKKRFKEYVNSHNLYGNYTLETRVREEDTKYWINYDMELHEYYYSQEKVELDEKEHDYNNKRKVWMKQKKKIESLEKMYRNIQQTSINKRHEKESEEVLEGQTKKSESSSW